MTPAEYRESHKTCPLIPCFPWNGTWRVPLGANGNSVSVSYRGAAPSDIHHIVLRSWYSGPLRDDPRNLLHVNSVAHDFVTDRTKAGFVLSLYAKHVIGELDVCFIRDLMSPRQLPGLLEMDDYREKCGEFPWMEPILKTVIKAFT